MSRFDKFAAVAFTVAFLSFWVAIFTHPLVLVVGIIAMMALLVAGQDWR